MENNSNDDEDDGLFAPIEKIFADFDRFFSGFANIFSIPLGEENPPPSSNLRDEVLKQDFSKDHSSGDEDLDSTLAKHGFNRTFSSSSTIATMQRQSTPSGKCILETRTEKSSNTNGNTQTETVTKICGEQYHTTVRQDGKTIREYGNATLEQLDQIDSSSSPSDNDDKHGSRNSDFFRKLFS